MAEHHRAMRTHYRNDSAATELGNGDEPEIIAARQHLASHGIHISEEHLREQRQAYERARRGTEEIGQLGRPVTAWPDIPRPIEPMSQAEYEDALAREREQERRIELERQQERERRRQRRRARDEDCNEGASTSSAQQERQRIAAQVESNLRTHGLL